jgi:hypothetical protein
MDEKSILSHIHELVDEEHGLRQSVLSGKISSDDERTRLRELEEQLDQAWDLLRRRRAARAQGVDPDRVDNRPVDQVENYLQ